jgi:hypothetical protein
MPSERREGEQRSGGVTWRAILLSFLLLFGLIVVRFYSSIVYKPEADCGCRAPVKPAWEVCSAAKVSWATGHTRAARGR